MPIYKCDCCGFIQDFADGEVAFEKGWDAAPHFYGYTTCDLCPAAFQFDPQGWAKHKSIHERWEADGRPEEYSQETCLEEEDWIDPEQLAAVQDLVDEIKSNPEYAAKLEAVFKTIQARYEG